MKILVTGANGFLGKIICATLEPAHDITKLLRKPESNGSVVLADLKDSNITLPAGYDMVIHSASLAHGVPKTQAQAQAFYDVNYTGVCNLMAALDKCASLPKYFVLISTVSVYGKVKGDNISENSPLQATDAYGKSKILAEKAVLDWCQNNKVICTILRPAPIVGHNAPSNLGKLVKAIKAGYYIGMGHGAVKKSMVLASDIPNAIMASHTTGGVYNLTDGAHPTMLALENAIAAKMNRKKLRRLPLFILKPFCIIGQKVNDILRKNISPLNMTTYAILTNSLTFDDTRAREGFGWAPKSVLSFYE